MQTIINAMAIFSFGVTSFAVAGGIYVYTSRGAIIEGVKSKVLEQVSTMLPDIVGGMMPEMPEIPSMTGGVSGGASLPSMTGGVTMPSIPGM